jgi:hypothetical protein
MKNALIGVLGLSLIIECVLTSAGFFAPDFTIVQFRVAVTPDTRFLAFAIAWLLLLVAIICGYTLKRVINNHPDGYTLSYILGFWWIAVGIGIYLGFNRADHLVLDTLKGLVIVILTKLSKRPEQAPSP